MKVLALLLFVLLVGGAAGLCETPTSPCSSAEYFNNPDISSNNINDSAFIRVLAICNVTLGGISAVALIAFLLTTAFHAEGTQAFTKNPYKPVKQMGGY